jgi:cytochrome P450
MRNSNIAAPPHVPPELIRRFDFRHDPAMEIDPWAEFAKLNDGPPVFYSLDQGGYWAVTRKTLIEEILSRPEVFSSVYSAIPRRDEPYRLIPPQIDPPDHTAYRKIITQRIFNSAALDTIESDARAFLRQRVADVAPRGRGDFMKDFAQPFPVAVFLALMGMPTARLSEFSDSIADFFRGDTPEKVSAAQQAVFTFAQDWLDSDPTADDAHMLRELKSADVDGRPLSGEELSIMVLTLFFAGLDTVTSQLSFFVHFLATHPAHLESLVKNPHLIPNAVEELLRRFGIANLARLVVEDIEFHGVRFRKNDLVMVSSTMAGVDESSYENALEVNFERPKANRHAAFGKGIHRCAGERLAKIELRVLLEEITPRLRNLRLQPGVDIRFLPGTIMSMTGLPVLWDDAGA